MQHLILLHGAIGSSKQLAPLAQSLSSRFQIHHLDLPGHGGVDLPAEFSIEFFADHVKKYCEQQGLSALSIFGYSMGGYVGMYLAKKNPELVERVVTLATKFHWDETIAAKEIKMLQPDIIRQKLPDFAKTLEERHAPLDWEEVLFKTAEMLTALGKDNALKIGDYASIFQKCLVMLGDRDKMVSLEETVAVYKALPNAQLSILPGTPHPIESVNVGSLSFMLNYFFG
jgi:pimeloyl-ACP methyl ester carboxylesterase